jgi:hypothetical protein
MVPRDALSMHKNPDAPENAAAPDRNISGLNS